VESDADTIDALPFAWSHSRVGRPKDIESQGANFKMMDMTGISIGMLGLVCLVAVVFLGFGIAALIKYLRS
jgi:hypothetical protein